MKLLIFLIELFFLLPIVELRKLPIRIAIVPPVVEAIPPKRYGGTERIVYYLTEELVKRGYNVTLFASGDSVTTARLFTNLEWPALWNRQKLANSAPDWVPRQWQMEQVQRHADDFDILHFHTDEHFNIVRHIGMHKTVTTLHKPTNVPGFEKLIQLFPDLPLVSVSNDQQTHIKFRPNFVATVHLGIPDQLPFKLKPEGDPTDGKPYLAFLGRISPLKGPDMAIEIAVKAGIRLLIAAKADDDEEYWSKKIKPMIEKHSDIVQYIGEINETQKANFLGNALALIFPINWDEPFGTVMIEAMSTGTPVIAKPRGSVKEVIKEGVTGLLFTTVEEGVQAVKDVVSLNRRAIRQEFEKRFTVEKMVDNYERVYQLILANKPPREEEERRCGL